MKINKQLRKHKAKKNFIKVFRTFSETENNKNGFILKLSKKFILMQNEEEFYLNGFSIFRKDKSISIRMSDTEKFKRNILKQEGIIESNYGIKSDIDIQSFESIFKTLKENNYFVIIECENLKPSTFTIGRIAKVRKKSVEIMYFAPDGIVDTNPTTIKFKNITLINFDDRYTNMYRKYLINEK